MRNSASFGTHWILRLILVALAYYVTGLIGLAIPFVDTYVTLIWAPSGIAMAALLRWGMSLWPAIWLASFAVNYSVDGTLALAIGIACGNTLGPVVGAGLLRHYRFDRLLNLRRDLLLYLLLGVAGAMLVTSSNGVLQLWLADALSSAEVANVWLVWWLGDAMGALVCGIPLLTLRWPGCRGLFGAGRGRELVLGMLLLLLIGGLLFTNLLQGEVFYHPVLYLPFFLLSWLAIRGGVAVASLSALMLSIQAVWATAEGTGPFLADSIHLGLAMLWGYMATATVIPVLITVLVGELRVSEQRLALATLGADMGMWEWNLRDDRLLHAYRLANLEHLSASEHGHTLRDIMHPEDVGLFEARLEHHLEQEAELFEAECRFRNKVGDWAWVLIRGQVVEFDNSGQPARMAGTLIDVSDRKQAETALLESRSWLQQSEERYRQLLANSPIGILNYDSDLIVTYVNARFAGIMQVPLEYMLGLDCSSLKDQRVVPALRGAIEGRASGYEGTYCTSYGGVTLWISMSCAPVTNEAGEIVGGIALLEDITARKQAEQELLKFKFFSDNASDMYMLADESTSIRYANSRACEVLGYSQAQLCAMTLPDIDPHYSREQVQTIIERCKQGHMPPFETKHRCRDGSLIPIEITARAHQLNGEWLCFTSARDISDRKVIEAREQRQRDGLTALNEVAALSHLSLQEQLQRALLISAGHFGLEYAIVSDIRAQQYRVLAHVSPAGTLEDDQCFSLGNTYCDITLQRGEVVAITEMKYSEHQHHPCYRQFELEAYIGAPVYVGGRVFGTVNFSGSAPYERAFDDGDCEFMRLLARWVGSVITLEQNRSALAESETRLKTIIETEPECVKVISPLGELWQMNRAGLDMLEVDSIEQVNRIGVINFVDEPYRAAFEELNHQALQGGTGSLEFTVTGRNGQVRWLDTHAAPLRDSDGSITAVLSVTRDITLLKQQQYTLEQLAHYDALTGLPNRALLAERMNRAVVLARRQGIGFAVCYLDLDGFKAINDRLGHEAGDSVLQDASRRLTSVLREVDTVARLGGDEFVLLLSDIHNQEACVITLERVLAAVSEPLEAQGAECRVSASIGIALYPDDGEDPETLLRHADQAMYVAKELGKNRYRFYRVGQMLLS